MKRVTQFFLSFLFIANFASAQESFQIKGKFIGLTKPSRLVLNYRSAAGNKNDTALIASNGEFQLKGQVNRPVMATAYLQEVNTTPANARRDYANFYVESGASILINGINTVKQAEITGGSVQTEYRELQDSLKQINMIFDNLSALSRSNLVADELKKQLRIASKDNYNRMTAIESRFIATHPSSIVSWEIVSNRAAIIDPDSFEPVFNSLSAERRQSPEGISMQSRLDLAKRLKIGNPAIEFTIPDVKGVPVSLSSYKGKYVLVDFWASWCGPCRGENPYMLKAYNNLKDQNFEILGVSLDDNKDKWLKAIEEDKLPWKQVSDLKGFNTIALTYGIRAIPQNFLLSPEGIIIGKDLRGEELESLIRKAMKL